MSLDLGGPALEVAIGLSFVFFLLSLVATSVTELIARWTKKRAKTLEEGLKAMLGDVNFANDLFKHPLVQTDVNSGKGEKDPSYVSARNFGLALVSLLKKAGGDAASEADPLTKVEEGVKAVGALAETDQRSPLGAQLDALLDEIGIEGEVADFRHSAEKWFDDTMERVSGWYTRWAKKITWIVAIVVAVGLNVSAVRIAERLADEPTVRSAVVAGAQDAVARGDEAPKATGKAAQEAVKELRTLKLPILWSRANLPMKALDTSNIGELLLTLAGWAITAFAISLGAPFWFDTLGKLARLRSTGGKPEEAKASQSQPLPQTLKVEVTPQPPPTG